MEGFKKLIVTSPKLNAKSNEATSKEKFPRIITTLKLPKVSVIPILLGTMVGQSWE